MIILAKFVENLNDLIFDSNLMQKQIADMTGIDPASINRYLKGECMPTVKAIIALAELFNCSVDFLLGLSNEKANTVFLPCQPVAERLNYYFNKSGLTGYELCKRANLPDSHFYDWLNGSHNPTLESLEKFINYFDCSFDEFLGRVN